MTKMQFQVQLNKKKIHLTATQLVFYKQSKVLEATDKNSNYYYLIFYKNNFINGAKRNQIKINSHVHQAFKNGIRYLGEHPITRTLIKKQKSFHLISFNQLYKSIQKKYTTLETALIFSYFDSFIKLESTHKLFRQTFYEYRRNGQHFAAYKLLNCYSLAYPNNKFAHDMLHNLQFQTYKPIYQNMTTLYEKDPIYFEASFESFKGNQTFLKLLFQLYREQNRLLDELAVRSELLQLHDSEENNSTVIFLLENFSLDDQLLILQQLKQHAAIREKSMQLLLSTGKANDFVHFLFKTDFQPTPEQMDAIITRFEQADSDVLSSQYQLSKTRLLTLCSFDARILDKLVTPFVTAFFNHYSLHDILDWTEAFRKANFHLPIEQKLRKMQTMTEDPDQQFALGELYVHFQQLEKSIDCFKWEMEMHPNNPKPVSYLSKIYNQLGQQEEATAYQQLFLQMNR
ncbi:hypothetical protein [Oceanobacillus profundus]|uniref:hypothetical protein n=2 Tax=Bacteria TaxID=2 RepID=UPI0026E34CF1|nr:hypothetical protein [Oceanobacillus profundus]MDO6448677.1 hypothetical protein [Oceanobacillus profundus]